MQTIEQELALIDEGIERAVLTCLMKQPSKMMECAVRIKDDDFVNENNRYLYGIMSSIYSKSGGKKCDFDISTLLSMAKQKGLEEDFIRKSGGSQYIEFLTIVKESMVSIDRFDFYIDRLTSLGIKRRLLKQTDDFKKRIISDGELSAEELIVDQQRQIDNVLLNSPVNRREPVLLGKNIDDFIADALEKKRSLIGYSTGFKELDKVLEGVKRKTLTIVCAPRKTGKTAFLMNLGINVGIKGGIPTLMISTEMSDDEIMTRIISNLSGIAQNKIIKGYIGTSDVAHLERGMGEFRSGSFYHLTMRDFTLEKIISVVRKFVHNTVGFNDDGTVKDCLVLFDYIKMPQVGVSTAKEIKEYKVLGQIADGLKILAGDLDIPIITAAQTNRAGEVANSFELTWFCDTFCELTKKTQKEMEKDSMSGAYRGNQRLKIIANRSGDENMDGIDYDYNGPTLTYNEVSFNDTGHTLPQ